MSRPPGWDGADDLSTLTVSGIRAVLRLYERRALSLDDAIGEIRDLVVRDRARRHRHPP